MIKLSIIVPVYKVELYIEKCINSLVKQDVPYSDYEIIIVDDGSPDKSMDIVSQKFSDYDNIKIVKKENGGLSSARNAGFRQASGDYIWYVDSDDWIEENCLGNIFLEFQDSPDTIALTSFIPEGDWSHSYYNKTDITIRTGLGLCASSHLTAAQFYICRREFLENKNLHFFEGILHEDSEYTPRMLYLANSLKLYNTAVYHYLKREGSITNVVNPKRCYDYIVVCNHLIQFNNTIVFEEDKKAFSNVISNALLELLALSRKADKKTYDIISDYFRTEVNAVAFFIKSYRLNTKLLGWISFITRIPIMNLYNILSKIRY